MRGWPLRGCWPEDGLLAPRTGLPARLRALLRKLRTVRAGSTQVLRSRVRNAHFSRLRQMEQDMQLCRVVARSHRDLGAWQRADAVRRRIVALCARPAVKRDFKFCDQADRAAASACRNIAEGFARYGHADFARFVTIARSSLNELLDSLDEAALKGYIDATEHKDFERAIKSAMISANALRGYLQSTPTPKERGTRRPKPGST